VNSFDHRLYWVGYRDSDPDTHLLKQLLKEGKFAFYVKGFSPDSFFVKLTKLLGCFPPDFVGKPFSHLENLYSTLMPYSFPDIDDSPDYLEYAHKFVQGAINEIEPIQVDVLQGLSDLLKEDYEKVIALRTKYPGSMHSELLYAVSWAYVMQGNELLDNAKKTDGEEADEFFRHADEKYAEAVKIKPEMHQAFSNWGVMLSAWALKKDGETADRLFEQANEKYRQAVKVKENDADTFNNWGSMLDDWARKKDGEAADRLFEQANEKFEHAVKIKENDADTFNNWGFMLVAWGLKKDGETADRLFEQANEKHGQAEKIKENDTNTFNNWDSMLDGRGRRMAR
jgi:Tfp pilus assembly protein PilF